MAKGHVVAKWETINGAAHFQLAKPLPPYSSAMDVTHLNNGYALAGLLVLEVLAPHSYFKTLGDDVLWVEQLTD